MSSTNAQQIVLASRPNGRAQLDNFRLEHVGIPAKPPGGLLLRTLLLSLDPYMRGRMDDLKSYATPVQIGAVMEGQGLAEILESDHPDHRPGDLVLAKTGWRTHAPSDGTGLQKIDRRFTHPSTRLGVLGMPGFTAYCGLNIIGKPQANETVVVAAASGPVGSLVGQLAKRAGARAVGIAGGPDKCRHVIEELGFDAAVDHRAPDLANALAQACPKGIDIYFENVGGAVWQAVLPLLNRFARVPVCGLISQYSNGVGTADLLPSTMQAIVSRSLTVRGFINYEFAEQFLEKFLNEIGPAIETGEINYREDITEGLENAPAAFLGMLDGKNFGKVLVRL